MKTRTSARELKSPKYLIEICRRLSVPNSAMVIKQKSAPIGFRTYVIVTQSVSPPAPSVGLEQVKHCEHILKTSQTIARKQSNCE